MPEFGSTPARDRCLQTLTYDLRLSKADDIAADFPIPMYKITGTVNEKRRCEHPTYVEGVMIGGGSIGISDWQLPPGSEFAPTCAPPPGVGALFQECPDKDEIKQSSQPITNSVLNLLKANVNCDTVTPGCLHNLKIDGECLYDLGPCGGLFGFDEHEFDPDTGTFDPGECSYDGPFDMKQEGFPGLDFTPGTDVPFGLIPQNLCDYSDYNTNCNLFEFIAEELEKNRPPGKYDALIQAVINLYINSQTGGMLTDIQGYFEMLRSLKVAFDLWQGVHGPLPTPQLQEIFGNAQVTYTQAIETAYAKYLNCLRSELSV